MVNDHNGFTLRHFAGQQGPPITIAQTNQAAPVEQRLFSCGSLGFLCIGFSVVSSLVHWMQHCPDKIMKLTTSLASAKPFLAHFGIKDIATHPRTSQMCQAAAIAESNGLTALSIKGGINLLCNQRGNPDVHNHIEEWQGLITDPKVSPMPQGLLDAIEELGTTAPAPKSKGAAKASKASAAKGVKTASPGSSSSTSKPAKAVAVPASSKTSATSASAVVPRTRVLAKSARRSH